MKNIINAVILAIVAMGLFAVLCAVLPSVSAFEPIGRAIDEIAVSDIYYSSIRDNRPVANDKFLIIDTSKSGRREISQAIDHAAEAGATVIGLDIIFSLADVDSSGTRSLQQAVRDNREVTVAGVHLNKWDEKVGRYVSTVPTPLDSVATLIGYTNLINRSDNSFIRNYSVAQSDAIPSFAQAIATNYLAAFGESAVFDTTDEGLIDFTPQDFTSVSAGDFKAIDTLATGRIVLLGALHADEDFHFTPVGAMSGVIIQAYAADTLLNKTTARPPVWPVRAGLFVIIFLIAWGFIVLRRNFERRNHTEGRYTFAMLGIGNLVYPTFAILLVIFIVGEIYVLSGCYISPLYTVGSLAFIPVAYDLQVIASGLFRRSTTVIALLIASALPSTASEQSPKSTVLPSWFEEAVANPDVYVGVAPPCTNGNAAEDMAIATAVINWLFNSGQYTAKVEGESDANILSDKETRAGWYMVTIESKEPVDIVLSDIFINDRKECFVACKIMEGTKGETIKFTKEIGFNEVGDSLYENSGFKIIANIRKLSGRYNRSTFRIIEGCFTHVIDADNNFYSLKTNNFSFDANLNLTYPNLLSQHPSTAKSPIEPNLGTSLFQLITTYPPALSEIKARTIIHELQFDKEIDKNESQIYMAFSNNGNGRPFNLRIAGLSGNDIYYTVAQEKIVKQFTKQYNKADLAEKTHMAYSVSRTNNKLGTSAGISMAYIDAISLWATSYDKCSVKGRSFNIDSVGNVNSAGSGVESVYEKLAEFNNFKLLWHIGDGTTTLPTDIVGKDFNYSCGASVVDIDSSEERLAAFAEVLAEQSKKADQTADSFIKLSKDTATANESQHQVKFKFRTQNNTKFSEPEFKLSFTTNSRKATYYISGESAPRTIPESALSAGVLKIELPRRDCDLTVADDAGQMHVLHFIYDEALSLRKSATLHILSIGVNDYEAQNLKNLKYAEDDARAVVETIASRHQHTFANINKTVIIGKDVTPERIGAEIEKIADNAGLNDLAIIFFAGHGLVDARNYYLATSKVTDSKVPRKGGFSARSFAEKIGYINCKLVIFIDACYSAKMLEQFRDGSVNNGEFFKELTTTPNGTNIYTSSGADVRSRELDEYGHGVFTQALIEACDFKNSDADGDGRITITEIRNYLEQRIVQMTNNEQRPIYRNLEEIDYSLFIR